MVGTPSHFLKPRYKPRSTVSLGYEVNLKWPPADFSLQLKKGERDAGKFAEPMLCEALSHLRMLDHPSTTSMALSIDDFLAPEPTHFVLPLVRTHHTHTPTQHTTHSTPHTLLTPSHS